MHQSARWPSGIRLVFRQAGQVRVDIEMVASQCGRHPHHGHASAGYEAEWQHPAGHDAKGRCSSLEPATVVAEV